MNLGLLFEDPIFLLQTFDLCFEVGDALFVESLRFNQLLSHTVKFFFGRDNLFL